MSEFHGWKFGGNLTEAQADQLEPLVDVMTEMLQQALLLPAGWLRQKSQHEIVLSMIAGLGNAAVGINDISTLLETEKNEDEKLLQLNLRAAQLRDNWLKVAVVAVLAITNLDNQLQGVDDDK